MKNCPERLPNALLVGLTGVMILLWSVGLSACNGVKLPFQIPTMQSGMFETLSSSLGITPTSPPSSPAHQSVTASPQPIATWTAVTQNDPNCSLAAIPGKPFDVTIPDGTEFQAGETFTKTWRFVNSGSCTWTAGYGVAWFSGAQLTEMKVYHIARPISPGEMVDISVDMTAPQIAGDYQSNWKLRSDDGRLYGIGPNGDAPFWASIRVRPAETPTVEKLPSPTTTPLVFLSGTTVVILDSSLDLDSGIQNAGKGDDIQFWKDSLGEYYLIPVNGSHLSPVAGETGFESCQSMVLTDEWIDLKVTKDGSIYCYRTTLGLPGVMKLDQISLTESYIQLSYTTWAVP